MQKILVANWKANPATLAEAKTLFEATQAENVIVCPPAVYLSALQLYSSTAVKLGSQDVFWIGGAHTGQTSTEMLKQFGVTHVLVGHSERRAIGETDEQINHKLKAILSANMTPILLIGEQEHNDAVRQDILIDQLTRDLEGVSAEDAIKILYCFEPAWAISTTSGNKSDSLESIIGAVNMMRDILHKMFKLQALSFKMLYGASVNGENCQEILSRPELQGAVVGGASLRADEFTKMIEIAKKL